MLKGLILAGCLVMSVVAQAGVYTCEVNGKKVFQNVPCRKPDAGTSKRLDNTMEHRTAIHGNGKTSNRRHKTAQIDLPPIQVVNFGTSSLSRFSKASAIIESVVVDGQSCEWDLKVYKDRYENCVKFLHSMLDDGVFQQSANELARLIEDDIDFFAANKYKFKALTRKAQKAKEYADFATVRINGY